LTSDEWTARRDAGKLVPLHDTTQSARDKTNILDIINGAAPPAESAMPHTWAGDDAQRAAARSPGGGSLGPAAELAAVYQCLLDGGRTPTGESLLRESTVDEMTSRQRAGLKDH